jgi:3-oxoacyl-(acyl-carrier-protein) reductase
MRVFITARDKRQPAYGTVVQGTYEAAQQWHTWWPLWPAEEERPMRLAGRTTLVTGASRGIGRAIALALAQEGADVAVNYVANETSAQQLVEEMQHLGRKAIAVKADVSDFPDTYRMAQEIYKEFGHLDILINNAGITSDKTFQKMDHASWRKVLSTNLDGVFNCSKVLIDGMIEQKWGRVVNITSVIGQIGNFGQVNYAASKAGVAAFTKSLAKEVAAKGITVNAVAPGFIDTEMINAVPEKIQAKLLEQIPMRRFGKVEEVARACVYLCSPDGDYITGSELKINGGLYM